MPKTEAEWNALDKAQARERAKLRKRWLAELEASLSNEAGLRRLAEIPDEDWNAAADKDAAGANDAA